MKLLLIMLVLFVAACTNQQPAEKQESNKTKDEVETTAAIPLNNANKWKADNATKTNVAALVQVVTDSSFTDPAKRKELYTAAKTQVDKLVSECKMQGAEHDALHVWLEKVIKDVKELKEDEKDEYSKAYDALKKDVTSFYEYFE